MSKVDHFRVSITDQDGSTHTLRTLDRDIRDGEGYVIECMDTDCVYYMPIGAVHIKVEPVYYGGGES